MRPLLLLFVALFSSERLFPQSSSSYVFNRAQFATGPTPLSLTVGDFNGDGKLDLAVANADSANGNSVSILLGKPDGTFAPKVDYATGAAPYSVIAADFNGDGKLDLAVAEPNNNAISILLGNGDGTFQPHADVSVGQGPRSLVAGDFNSDGKADLAVANQTDNSVSILLGSGDGTFQAQGLYAVSGLSPVSIATADFNGDGKLDLAFAGSGGAMTLQGNGDGTFQTPVFQPLFVSGCLAAFSAVSVVAADFDADGLPDLAVAGSWSGSCPEDNVSILLGNGDGSFRYSGNYPSARFAFSMIAADLNKDGRPDLVIGTSYGDPQPLSVLINNGNGAFQHHVDYAVGAVPVSVAAGDFNGDGNLDLATANDNDNNVGVLLGVGDGSFQPHTDYAIGNDLSGITTADFNKDGFLDLATADCNDNTASILLGNGNGTFQNRASFATGRCPVAVAAADFNGDGAEDLVTANSADNSVSVLLGNGNGTLQTGTDYSVPATPIAVSVADFDGDKNLDIAVLNDGLISIFFGNGDGTFRPRVDVGNGVSFGGAMTIADFNADGIPDLAVTDGSSSGSLAVLLGNGNGTFTPSYRNFLPFSPDQVAAGDFNRDGVIDLAVSQETFNGFVSVLLGTGGRSFQPRVTFATNREPNSAAVADFDGDGFLELFVGGSILLGRGDGTFQPHMDITSGRVAIGDFDGDGRPDLAVLNTGTAVSVYLNKLTTLTVPAPIISSIAPTSGSQGQTITNFTINGSNFDSGAILSFSGSGISIDSYSARTTTQIIASMTIVANTPIRLVDVTVTNSDGQHVTLPASFTLTASIPPIPGPQPPPVGSGAAGSDGISQATVSEPISTGNGNYYYQHTDFVVPGRGIPLVFQRSYNTLDNYAGPFGANWTHSYNVILTGTSAGVITIRWGDGHGETFTPSGNGYTNQPGVFSTLVRNADSTFLLTQKNQTKYAFSSAGKLTSIRDRNGNTISCTYNGNGNLSQVADAAGRSFAFSYDANSHIVQVTDPSG
jgi:YD repeat-containing protein